jgi:hypothetical protein
MLCLLEHIYHELGLVAELKINPIILRRWLVRELGRRREMGERERGREDERSRRGKREKEKERERERERERGEGERERERKRERERERGERERVIMYEHVINIVIQPYKSPHNTRSDLVYYFLIVF